MHRKFDISCGLDMRTKEAYFFIPIEHLNDKEPFIKMIIDKEYWPAVNEEKNHLVDLYIDTMRLKHSSILFNHCSAKSYLPDPSASDSEVEYKQCLYQFDIFLNIQFKSLKENILKQYKQDLINFPGNILFQSLAIEGHTLREKTFEAEIQGHLSDHSFGVVSIIQNIKYVPRGKDPFNEKDILPLGGSLRSRLEYIEESEKKGFNISIETESPEILALILGEVTNKQYVQFLEDFLKTKKTAFSFLNEIYTTIKKSQSIFNEFKDLENISTQWKREQDAIEECFDAVSGLHAELDILLASQDRDTMSPFKLKKDILTLNQCERKLNELTKKFKSKNNNIQCLIQARNSWFSKENSPDLIFESAGVLDNLRQYPDITCMPW